MDTPPLSGQRFAPSSQRGFSLVEVIISSSILLIMVYAVTTLSISGKDAQEYASRMNRATEISQIIMDDLRLELVSAVQVFGDDTTGNDHLAIIDLTGYPPMLGAQRLPRPTGTGLIEPDTVTVQRTGNALFYARQAWVDEFATTSGEIYRLDVYRWVLYYLTPEDGGAQPGRPIGLNMVQLVSEPMVDGEQVDRITDPDEQEEVLTHLALGTAGVDGVARTPVHVAWRRTDDIGAAGTLRQISASNGTMSTTPSAGRPNPWRILPDTARSRPNLLSYRHHSVATNFSRTAMGVARYGLEDPADGGFPHGFEVQLVGPSSARQLMLHLVIASTNNRGQRAWSDLTTLIDVRDL